MQLSRNASLRALQTASWKDTLPISVRAIHPASLHQSEIQKNQHICPTRKNEHICSLVLPPFDPTALVAPPDETGAIEPPTWCFLPVLQKMHRKKGADSMVLLGLFRKLDSPPWRKGSLWSTYITILAMTKAWKKKKKSLFLWRSQFVLQPVRGRERLWGLSAILWSWVRCTRTILSFSRPFYNL